MARRPRGDDGFTLMDVMVGMLLMGVFMAMFAGSVVLLFGSSNHSAAVTDTSQQLSQAFMWLDRHVRYADYVSQQGQGSDGNWYVEFREADGDPGTCYQLRVDRASDQLQQRSWIGTGPVSAWTPLAGSVTNGAAAAGSDAQPFVFARAVAPVRNAQLTVHLVSAQGAGTSGASSVSSMVFAALNTDAGTLSRGTCDGKRP